MNLPAAKSILSNEIFIINLCLALSIYCFPDGEFLYEKILLNKNIKKTYTITEVVGFFVKVPLLRLQLVIITKSLNKKIHRSFLNPDGD
jgi:hypothetical protein